MLTTCLVLDMGTMNLDISTDGGTTWTNIWTQVGQVQGSGVDPWETESINLKCLHGRYFIEMARA